MVVQPAPPPKPLETLPVQAKWEAMLYGFVEADSIYDSTQGLVDLAGNTAIARPNTYAGDHGQTTFGARNSRIGIKLAAPTHDDITATGQLEMDFLGNQAGQPPGVNVAAAGVSEAAFWQNPTFRFRHLNVKLATPAFDILIGQYWQLFGWQTMAHPNTVEIQGVPGQIYSRAPQIRVSKTIKSGDLAFELAVAAARPPQRASGIPDGHAGIKLSYNKLQALHTAGGTGTALDGLSVGASVVGRRFSVDEFSANPSNQVSRNGYGLSLDALIPIIPATKTSRANALTLTASFVDGAGIADLYTGLSGGVAQPALPNPNGTMPAPVYNANVDNGLVMFTPDQQAPDCATNPAKCFSLHPVQWVSYIGGLQYYLPPSGKVWVSANFSHMNSPNADNFGAATKVWNTSNWADANLMVDVTPAVRLGFEYAWFQQTYVDGTQATNHRAQFSAFLLF